MHSRQKKVPLDVSGVVTSMLGVALLLYGLSEAGSKGWGDIIVVSTIVIGLISLALFVVLQLRSKKPMLDFRVFKYDMFSLTNIINVILTIAMFSGMFLLPIFLQNLRGFTALQSGLLMLPGAVIMGIMSPVSGVLFDKIGPRPLALIGMFITVLTTYEFTKLTLETSFSFIMILNMIRFFGMSFLMMPIMTAGMNQLPESMNSHGTAMSNTLRQISGSLGISIVTTIFTSRTTTHLVNISNQANVMDSTFYQSYQSFVNSVANTAGIPASQAQGLATSLLYGQANLHAAVMGISDAFMWATGFTVIGFLLSFFIRDVRKDQKVKQEKAKREEITTREHALDSVR